MYSQMKKIVTSIICFKNHSSYNKDKITYEIIIGGGNSDNLKKYNKL